ncbi:MAG: PhoH family protein [Nitrospinaceae bacterium]|nr:PhoH family protein [Nitrospinaceae bacterium]HIK57587.1 PhoH family protein [Nitrospinaceae bacterium]
MKPDTKEIVLENNAIIPELFGSHDLNLKLIEKKFNVRITTRENHIRLKGNPEDIELVDSLFMQLEKLHEGNLPIEEGDIRFAIRLLAEDPQANLKTIFSERIAVSPKKGYITPKGPAQYQFIQAIRENDIVLSIGPAGTGKTYLAVAMAVEGLLKRKFKKIVLVRPAVEAGEKLGFLPGDIADKINPYLMPLYDALNDMIEDNQVNHLIEDGAIEIVPLAYMRGRTLSDSFIILDEAQNATREQMKMFLTRLGFRSKMVITGDTTQIDLPKYSDSGLIHVQSLLEKVEGIQFVYFSTKDVVRHELVKKIIKAYAQPDLDQE